MDEIGVRFVNLEPMHVASFTAISESPENGSFQKLLTWAQPKEHLNDLKKHSIYGFDNPRPSPENKEYGYEFWIKIDNDYQENGIVTKTIPAVRYAVTTCHSLKNIGRDWKRLIE